MRRLAGGAGIVLPVILRAHARGLPAAARVLGDPPSGSVGASACPLSIEATFLWPIYVE
jgi:hypothetical protein